MGDKIFLLLCFPSLLVFGDIIVWESDVCKDFDVSTCDKLIKKSQSSDDFPDGIEVTHEEACPPPRKLYHRFDPDNPCCKKVFEIFPRILFYSGYQYKSFLALFS